MTDIFVSVLKTSKVLPVFKKDSKLDYSNYRPISLLSNIEKMLEKLMCKRLYTFFNNNNIYNLQFRFRQQYSTSHALINVTENIRKVIHYGNDLNQAIKFSKIHHIADDTNLLCMINSIKTLNKLVNADLKRLVDWLNSNNILLIVKKN